MTPAAVILTVLGYIAVLFVVAWLSGRRADNAGFFTGNRRTPWYMAAFAMIGAAMSGVTFISVPGSVAVDSFSYMQMVAGFTVGQLIVACVLIPTFYRLRVVSLYEYLDDRFGVASHRTGAWFFFLSKMLGAALRVYVVCAVLQLLVFSHYGIPFWANALVTMAFVWLYTRQGGVKSLIWTDTLKTLCLVGSLVLSILFIMRALDLSAAETAREVARSPMSRIFFFDDPASGRYFWKMFAAGIVLLVAMTGLDQDMMQRNLSCATPRDSQKNIVLTAVSQIFVIFLFLVLGVLLYLYADRTGLPLPAKSDQVFSMVAVEGGLPLVVGILFVVGLISSTYSAAGSALTALTTSFTVDILEGTKQLDDCRLTRLRKGVHVGMALLMAGVILAFEYWADDSVINLVYKVASYTYGPILGMFAFGMMTRRRVRDRWMPLVAVAAPVLSALLQFWARERWDYQIGFELLIYNAAFTVIGMYILSQRNEK
ncbi:sodium:solute symporter [Alistipes sp. An116]|uniref:sodium:solute symporter n=1 Tax=unclassified Alistipes TaxID=2608932 RepID=UPI000B3969FC|nr:MULTISPECIES: sodium:solute symporter [unclassified Alistipes]OUN77832.1 sodium:solute symporter [Alistipes sp. An54]OUQ53627.1 sodium:solute symporter [Alistipes sp. An116]